MYAVTAGKQFSRKKMRTNSSLEPTALMPAHIHTPITFHFPRLVEHKHKQIRLTPDLCPTMIIINATDIEMGMCNVSRGFFCET